MSIVSGLMMGAAIGNSVRELFTGGASTGTVKPGMTVQQKELQLVAAIPGRRRYRIAGLTTELAALLEEKLNQLSFIRSFKANAVSGSLLFLYDASDEDKMNALEKWLRRKLFRTEAAGNNRSLEDGGMPTEAHAGSLTRSVRQMGRAFSGWIKAHTGGVFDTSSLASMFFILRGIRKVLITGQYPSGPQMLWWALSLMRGWRTV